MSYQIGEHTRRCAATGRSLLAGEAYYAVLREVDGELLRVDYGCDVWQGPPSGIFGFWKGRVPSEPLKPSVSADPDRLLALFDQWCGEPPHAHHGMKFVLALYLMRRRVLKLSEVRQADGGACWLLHCARNGRRYEVADPELSGEELASHEQRLQQLLISVAN